MRHYSFYIIFIAFWCIINTVGAQQPVVNYTTPFCVNQNWTTPNDSLLWHETYWWNEGAASTDKSEEPVDLCINVKDSCAGLHIGFLLFLDLDNNNIQETVIRSEELGAAGLGWNNIRYDNGYTPNYSGGVPRAFDERPVPAEQKYGFALEVAATDSGQIACVRFNTQAAPDTFLPLQLPHGRHRVVWVVSDSCNYSQEFEQVFTVQDCEAPVLTCKPVWDAVMTPIGYLTIPDSSFIQSLSDNCTPVDKIKISARKCGEGTGFPTGTDIFNSPVPSIGFDCCEAGLICVEIWVMDESGNIDSCITTIEIMDVLGNCDCFNTIFNVRGHVKTAYNTGISDATVFIDGTSSFSPPFSYYDLSDANGEYRVDNNVPVYANNVNIKPERKDNPLNGVTTYDLVLISKHILGVEPLATPYKMIAADANKSGSITSFDMVELRKLILGIYNELPANDSWRFVDKSFVFPNTKNPFQTPFPEYITIDTLQHDVFDRDFTGVKVGDVNDTAAPNAGAIAPERSTSTTFFEVADRQLQAGEVFDLRCMAAEPLEGFQFTLSTKGIKVLKPVDSQNVTTENFNLSMENALAVSINGAQEFTLRCKAEKAGRLSEMLSLGDGITRAEAYGKSGLIAPELRFDGNVVPPRQFELFQNRPNPFSSQTDISFYLPEANNVTLSVFDATGRVVYHQETWFEAGVQQIRLDKKRFNSDSGQGYFLLQTGQDSAVRKIAWF